MKKPVTLITLLLLLSGAFFFIKNSEEERLIELLEKEKFRLQQKVQTSTIQRQYTDLEFTELQLKKLKEKWNDFTAFEYNNAQNWHKHKDFIEQPNVDSLQAVIKKDGSLGLISNYFGNYPINHYQIQAKIGDILIDSSKVHQMTSRKSGRTVNVNESLFFENDFASSLIQQIYINTEADIEITLIGKDAFKSFTLSKKQKNAFKETWALHKMIAI